MKKKTAVIVISMLSAASVALGAFSWAQSRKLADAKLVNQIYGERALNELAESISSMDESLRKSLYATSAPLFTRLCTDAATYASSAVTALTGLPYSTYELEKTSRFINGAGDYVLSLSRAASEGDLPDEDGMKNIKDLSATLKAVSAGLTDVRQALSDSALCLDNYGSCSDDGAEDTVGFEMQQIEEKLPEYPELIYDGQFTETADDGGSKTQISEGEAKRAASLFLGVPEQQLAFRGSSDNSLPSYHFSISTEDGEEQQISVTKRDGAIAEWSNSNRPDSGSVTEKDAAAAAAEFMAKHGYDNMTEISRKTDGGVFSVSYAYSGGGVVCMSDMVIVGVALDSGKVCSLIANEYQKNHSDRDMLPSISQEEAVAAVPDSLKPVDSSLVCTKLTGSNEYVCYKITCNSKDDGRVIVYVDAQTGDQKMIEFITA